MSSIFVTSTSSHYHYRQPGAESRSQKVLMGVRNWWWWFFHSLFVPFSFHCPSHCGGGRGGGSWDATHVNICYVFSGHQRVHIPILVNVPSSKHKSGETFSEWGVAKHFSYFYGSFLLFSPQNMDCESPNSLHTPLQAPLSSCLCQMFSMNDTYVEKSAEFKSVTLTYGNWCVLFSKLRLKL